MTMTAHTHTHDGVHAPRLLRAALRLPVANARQRRFASWLQERLVSLRCAAAGGPGSPQLHILEGSTTPSLQFDDDCRLRVGQAPGDDAETDAPSATHAVIAHQTLAPCVPPEQIFALLEGALLRLNHIGVNVPETARTTGGWDAMVARLGKSEWLYRLETGTATEILFLLPVTPEEYARGTLAPERREHGPMIELCCSDITPGFTLHFNFETRLTRAELLRRFSDRAVFKPGDEAFFLSVCAASPWAGLTIYFDLSYADPGSVRTSRELIVSLGRRQR